MGQAAAEWRPAGGGLSDASVWRVERAGSAYAIRRWPAGIGPGFMGWVADSLRQAAEEPYQFIAAPLGARGEHGLFRDSGGGHWEAARWKPGEPLASDSSADAVAEAVRGLAGFHAGVRTAAPCPVRTRSAWQDRGLRLKQCLAGPSVDLHPLVAERWPELTGLVKQLPASVALCAAQVAQVSAGNLGPSQAIHGDPRPEHFLLNEGRLAGLIDFGAMRTDSVLVDVARLAGELALGDSERLNEVVSIYEAAAGLPIDGKAVAALDASGAVLSAINWIRWLSDPAGPQRDASAVQSRLRAIAARLPRPRFE